MIAKPLRPHWARTSLRPTGPDLPRPRRCTLGRDLHRPPGALTPPAQHDRRKGAMAAGLIRCEHCGRANRVPAAAAGSLRCGSCHQPLAWVADADDDTFAEIAEA